MASMVIWGIIDLHFTYSAFFMFQDLEAKHGILRSSLLVIWKCQWQSVGMSRLSISCSCHHREVTISVLERVGDDISGSNVVFIVMVCETESSR